MPRGAKKTQKVGIPKRKGRDFSKSEKERTTCVAYYFNNEEIQEVRSLLKEENLTTVPVLTAAVALNKYELVKQLIHDGCNVNEFGPGHTTPLMWAVKLRHMEIVNLLLAKGADSSAKDGKGYGALFLALENKLWDEEAFIKLWNNIKYVTFADIDFEGRSVLHATVKRGWNQLLNILISEKVNVNATNSNNVTALMLASYLNNLNMVSALLEADADVLKEDACQSTALTYAIAAVVCKNIQKPHLVIEKLLSALEVHGITFEKFLENVIDAILNRPVKLTKSGRTAPDATDYIIPYTLQYRNLGIRSLLGLHIFKRVTQATERNMSSCHQLIKYLMILNSLLLTRDDHDSTLESFITDGGANICLEILKKYGCEENCDFDFSLAFNILVRLSIGHSNGRLWLQKNCEEIIPAYEKMKIKYSQTDAHNEDAENFFQFTELINLIIEEKLLKQRCDITEESKEQLKTVNTIEIKTKQIKRRAKDLNTKSAKIENVEELNQNGKKFLEYKSASDTSILRKSKKTTRPETSKEIHQWAKLSTWEQLWLMDSGKDPLIREYHEALALLEHEIREDINHSLHDTMQAKPSSCHKKYEETRNEDGKLTNLLGVIKGETSQKNINAQFQSSLNYLSELLNKIVQKFEYHWVQDTSHTCGEMKICGGFLNVSHFSDHIKNNSRYPHNPESIKKLELVHVERLRAEFNDLVVQLNNSANDHLVECIKLMVEIENLLLNFKVRGKSIIDDTMLTMKENNYDQISTQLINDSDTKNECPQPPITTCTSADHLDALYLTEMLSIPLPRPINYSKMLIDRENTMKNAYHLCDSIEALLDGDSDFEESKDDDDNSKCRKRLSIEENLLAVEKQNHQVKTSANLKIKCVPENNYDFLPSRWCNVIKSLQLLKNHNVLLNGDIRVSGKDTHDLHIISTGGSFSAVILGLDSKNRPLAVKRIKAREDVSKLMKDLINPLLGLRNANVLHYFTCHHENNELVVATPLCEYNMGEYLMFMKQHGNMHLRAFDVVKQFLSGLRFLHDRKEPIVHGNLKPSNIFLDLNGNVRIAEFGIHKALYTSTEAPNTSLIWFARETLNNFRETACVLCTCASDVQVAGMIMHFIFSAGKHPFGETMDDILKNLENAIPHLLTNNIDLHDLISWMLLYDPGDRPSINQILNHVFFWSLDKKWRFILACAGLSTYGTPLDISVKDLFLFIKIIAVKENIKGKWISLTKQRFPNYNYSEEDEDSVAGLLAFIRSCVQNEMAYCVIGAHDLHNYILETFPALPLSLYRILESSQWLSHNVLKQFTTANCVSA